MPPAAVMVNVLSLVSLAVEAVSEIRTRHRPLLPAGTAHEKVPAEAAVLPVMIVQVPPSSSVYSSLTLATPEELQVMGWLVPPAKLSPPLGAVTVTVGLPPPPHV